MQQAALPNIETETEAIMPTSAKNANAKKVSPDRDKLVADLKALIEDARTLTADVAETSQEAFTEKVTEVQDQIKEAVDKLKEHGQNAKEMGKESIDSVEKLVKDNPWKSLGIAVLAGILIDRLIRE